MRKRRIIVVLVVFFLAAAGVAGAVYFRQRTLDQRASESRSRGLEAVAKEDWVVALDQIGRYLQRFGQEDDAEALCEYARARSNVPLPNGQHVQQAMTMFRRTLEIDPGNQLAQHELLLLYDKVGYGNETTTLANSILEKNPDDIPALRAKARANARIRNFAEALEVTSRIAELAPADTENHLLSLALMNQMGKPSDEILAYAQSQQGLDPEEAPYQLVQSIAHELTGNHPEAIRYAKLAASNAPAEPDVVVIINRLLEGFGLYDDSLELLKRTASNTSDLGLKQLLFRRLFEVGDIQSIIDRTKETPITEEDTMVLALRALAYGRVNQTSEIDAVISELESRTADHVAQSWVPVLRFTSQPDTERPIQDVIADCKAAIEQQPENPYFHYFLGLAYERIGELELAFDSLKAANQGAPAWVDPVLRTAVILASAGSHSEASSLAQQALMRAPKDVNVAATVAQIIGSDVQGLSPDGRGELLKLVEKVQSVAPLEPRTLPILVELQILQGDAPAAVDEISAVLAGDQAIPEQTLLQLARISDKFDLGLAQACYERMSKSGSISPAAAYTQAIAAHQDGDTERGKQLLTNAAKAAGNGIQWSLVMAQFLEVIGDDGAVAAWAAVADADENNVALQRRVLDSRAAWQDEELISRVIERVRESTGENAVAWRLAEARLLLQTDSSEKAAADAVVKLHETLTSSTFPQVSRYTLMAAAFKRLGNIEEAINNLQQAARLSKDSSAVRFELVELLQRRGDFAEASRFLDEILQNASTSTRDRRIAAALLARQGQVDRAIETLLLTYPPENRENPPDLLLAQLCQQSNQFSRAEAICRRVLAENPSPTVIAFTANLLGAQGKQTEAQSVLAQLDDLELEPGSKELILAEYQRSHGTPEECDRWYQEAIAANPNFPAAWRRYLAFLVYTKPMDEVFEALEEAFVACPDDSSFATLSEHRDLLGDLKRLQDDLQKLEASSGSVDANALRDLRMKTRITPPLVLAAIESPDITEQAVRALETVRDANGEELAIQLRQLSDTYPSFLRLKMQLARLYGSLGRHREATDLASRAMADFPGEVEPAFVAAESYAALGEWTNALEAAKQWRSRSGSRAEAADLQIAEAQIRLGQSAAALDTLQPYVQESSQDPGAYSVALVQQARALAGSGRIEEAAGILEPRLETSAPWRMAWVRLAAVDITSPEITAAWLERVTPLIPEDSVEERAALASAWYKISVSNGAFREKARAVIRALTNAPGVSASTALRMALIAEQHKDFEIAEANYRKTLQLEPNNAIANNNLAMCLITANAPSRESVELAKKAVETQPDIASFHDTLAQAYAARGDFEAAADSQARALELSPAKQEFRSRLQEYQRREIETRSSQSPVSGVVP